MTVSKSPDRLTFQKNCYLDRCAADGKQPDEERLAMFEDDILRYDQRFDTPESKKYNLEYELLTTDWILEKVRTNNVYAQNLYAALCNMTWQNKDMWKTLKEETWSCSWRYAGGIIADMQQEGDYIDWYCSGIRGGMSYDVDEDVDDGLVPEGTVTDEIAADLDKLGWIPKPYTDKK